MAKAVDQTSVNEADRPGLPTAPGSAVLPLLVVAAVIAWWGWKSGAYFGVVFFPGAIILFGLLAALLLFAPWPASLRGPAAVALASLLGIAALSAVSALWSPVPAIALEDALRVLAYAIAFALGIWLCLLLGRRMLLALAPLAGAGAVVAVATLIALWVGDNAAEFLEDDATLRYPLGYRNAEAAYFMVALWPMLVLAAARDLTSWARGALLGAATLSIELGVLSQSRGAVFALVAGVVVLVAVHPARLRMIGYIALAALPAALSVPWLLDVYQLDAGDTAASIPPLHTACLVMAISSVASGLLGLLVARVDPELPPRAAKVIGRALLVGLAACLLVGAVVLARADGGPAGFLDTDQLSEGTPDLSDQGSRFGFDLRSNRGDLWRVAIDDLEADPLTGQGAGGFRSSYLLDRSEEATEVQPEDPHSVLMLMASELGLPGVLLLVGFVVGATLAALRTRKLGPSAAALVAGALATGAYWLVHASVEWFWAYPAITLPMAFAVGAAAAPALLRPAREPRQAVRVGLVAALAVVSLAMIPPFLSERYTNHALRTSGSDLAGAYSDLQRAADLNPLSTRPLASEAVIAENAGEPARALEALSEAQQREPDEWTLYFLEARVLAPSDPAAASEALARARELNPRGREIDKLERTLSGQP